MLAIIGLSVGAGSAIADARSATAASSRAGIRGIYVIVSLKQTIGGDVARALENPNVDGALIKDTWANVQPTEQDYDWSRLDDQLAKVKSLGKKVSIALFAGDSTPGWVYKMGARSFSTVVVQRKNSRFCDPIAIPVPWDPIFLHAWANLVTAFGHRYGNDPAVAMIKITGLNYHSDEIQLPHAQEENLTSVDGTRSCHVPDQVAQWTALGYTSTRVAAAFQNITDTFGRVFPNTPLAIMTGVGSFPGLGPDGRPNMQAAALATTDSDGIESLLSYGRRTFAGRFVAQNNGLRARFVDPGIAAFSATNPTGYQFDWPVDNDRNCIVGGKKGGCDTVAERQSIISATINNALQAHAEFLELFPVDIVDPSFETIISDAHRQLWATPG